MDRRSFIAGTAALGTVASGAAPRGARAQDRRPLIAVFTKNVTNPFWRAVRIGCDKAGQELGVAIEHVAPPRPDNIEDQTRQVEDWIVRRPDAFVFVPVDYRALVPSIQKATQAGIPIVNFNNRMEGTFVSYVGSDDETIGYEISRHLFRALNGRGQIVHIDGVPAAITAQARKRGFERALAEFPEIRLLASQPANYRRLPAVQVFENLMQRFPQIDGVVCANDDMAVGVAEALQGAGRLARTKVVGIDAIPDAAAAIRDGRMLASADFNGHDQGYLAVQAAARHLRGERVPREIMLPVVIVERSNVEGWLIPIEQRRVPDWNAIAARSGA
jgi:ribose transport system substrate-binding protein